MTTAKAREGFGLSECLQHVMEGYVRARRVEEFGRGHSIWCAFGRAAAVIKAQDFIKCHANLQVKWSVGQGRWATVPWLAILDARETEKPIQGFYVVYLFREDMSACLLSLNQGSSDVLTSDKEGALETLRWRADRVATRLPASLAAKGWAIGVVADLRPSTKLARAYEAGSAAHRAYHHGAVPEDSVLLDDLRALIDAYREVVPILRD
jgi:hypothetical protein